MANEHDEVVVSFKTKTALVENHKKTSYVGDYCWLTVQLTEEF